MSSIQEKIPAIFVTSLVRFDENRIRYISASELKFVLESNLLGKYYRYVVVHMANGSVWLYNMFIDTPLTDLKDYYLNTVSAASGRVLHADEIEVFELDDYLIELNINKEDLL